MTSTSLKHAGTPVNNPVFCGIVLGRAQALHDEHGEKNRWLRLKLVSLESLENQIKPHPSCHRHILCRGFMGSGGHGCRAPASAASWKMLLSFQLGLQDRQAVVRFVMPLVQDGMRKPNAM